MERLNEKASIASFHVDVAQSAQGNAAISTAPASLPSEDASNGAGGMAHAQRSSTKGA